ncbi:hypothetical protein A2U01_0011363 [Trifolium medium]|uniref:Uncharacterized protein n=1 Tax=Trifolium medium TaxID=97028 RepID=A0A392MSF6_9FABA|nr:hypothetical protein [Trifolium medium]
MEKMVLAEMAMRGRALQWWLWVGSSSSLKEPDQESSPLVDLIEYSPESLNDTLQAWDEFLLSTEQMEVPSMRSKHLMGKTEIPTSDFNGGIVDLPDSSTIKLIDTLDPLGCSKTVIQYTSKKYHL